MAVTQQQAIERLAFSGYYSEYFADVQDRDGTKSYLGHYAFQKDLTFSTRVDLATGWTAKAEIHYLDGLAQVSAAETVETPQQHWLLFALKTSLSF